MDHDLAPSARPDCIVEMPARFAEPMVSAGRLAQRLLEISRVNYTMLGVLVTAGEPLYGQIDVAKAAITNAQGLSAFIGSPKLDAHKTVVGEFRRVFNGTMRSAAASLHDAFGGARIYLVFYEEGVCAVVPARTGHGRWRLAALKFLGAATMEEERACVAATRSSTQTYGIVWNMLIEIARREVREDPGLRVDLMDEPVSGPSSGGWRPEGDGRPDFPPVDEDDYAERDYDDPWADSFPDDRGAPPEPMEPSDPRDLVDPMDETPPPPTEAPDAGRSYEELEDEIDDQAVELEDPTDPSRGGRAPDPHDGDEDADGMETINF